MSNTKYTPGPWSISNHTKNDIVAYNKTGITAPFRVASAAYTRSPNILAVYEWEQAEANAKLIAAAPELLETLERIKPYTGYLPSGFKEEVENAIKKATE